MKQRKHFLTGLVAGLCALAPALADVPIDPTVTGSRQIVLDHHQGSGNSFAVVRGADPIDFWALHISTDQGASWSAMDDVTTSGDWIDVDIAVAGDYVYVGYAMASFGEAGISRFFAADGSFDSVYGYRSLIDVFPTDVVEVALASDQDGADNEIYYAFIASDGTLRFFFDSSADGTTFAELSPGISDAVSGLDMTFNPGSPDHQVLLSYWQDPAVLRVWRSFPWESVFETGTIAPLLQSRISAYGDRVIFCYEGQFTEGLGILTYRSYDAGDSWSSESVDAPAFPGEGDYGGCDVTARRGDEFAVTYMHEEGDFDPVYLRRHTGGESAPWGERVVINETDVAMTSIFRTRLNWFAPHYYGIAYIEDSQGTPYFDRFPMFADGFESGDTSAWSSTVP